MNKYIQLTKGKTTKVGKKDYNTLSIYKWHTSCWGYAARATKLINGKRKYEFMHHYILPKKDGLQIDHINGDKLDNRRVNLRYCTELQNHSNVDKRTSNTSGFKGVYWHKLSKKWGAEIGYKRKRYHLGLFKDKIIAASAYNEAAKKYFGIFTRLNTLKGGDLIV